MRANGVSRSFLRGLATGECRRTGCSVLLDAPLEAVHATLCNNLLSEAARNPECTVRLVVRGSRSWYRTDPAESVLKDTVIVAASPTEARMHRCADVSVDADTIVPAQVCVLEEAGTANRCTLATWLFRHDVMDGWRCLRYLSVLLFDTSELTMDRLLASREIKKRRTSLMDLFATALLTPAALGKLVYILCTCSKPPRSLDSFSSQRYLHLGIPIGTLRGLAQSRGIGSLSQTLTCVLVTAYLRADPTRGHATVGTNLLFDAEAPSGNHLCLKVARIQRPTEDASAADILAAAASTLRAPSQQLVDACLVHASKAYATGRTPACWDEAIEARHRSLDLIVSNLPAFDATEPKVLDLQVSRDFTVWTPSIVYAVGSSRDQIFLDFYLAPQRTCFDEKCFMDTFVQLAGARDVHTRLPGCY